MKIAQVPASTTSALDPNAQSAATQKAGQVGGKSDIDPEKLRLAREFEQIFIRKMLSSLEKTGSKQAGASGSTGGDAYGSMAVSALAEAVSKGGGIGLADMIARAASQEGKLSNAASAAPSTAALHDAIAKTTATEAAAAATSGAAHLTVPQNVRITVSQPPPGATYPRPSPITIINENHDIQDSLKVPNR